MQIKASLCIIRWFTHVVIEMRKKGLSSDSGSFQEFIFIIIMFLVDHKFQNIEKWMKFSGRKWKKLSWSDKPYSLNSLIWPQIP